MAPPENMLLGTTIMQHPLAPALHVALALTHVMAPSGFPYHGKPYNTFRSFVTSYHTFSFGTAIGWLAGRLTSLQNMVPFAMC
jgi:hypothetical protein